jgi:hypothetical protein
MMISMIVSGIVKTLCVFFGLILLFKTIGYFILRNEGKL